VKRGTPDHPKTRRLARRLGIHIAQAVGHLEMFWHEVAEYAPQGDCGRNEDRDLEEGAKWPGSAGAFVAALVAERFVDEDAAHRLVVHDWSEHADGAVHRKLARAHLPFADGTIPKLAGLTKLERERAEQHFRENGSHMTAAGLPPDCRVTAAGPSHGSLPRPAPPRPTIQTDSPSPSAARAAEGPSRRAQVERDREAVVAYWVQLGGHPDRKDRRMVWEALQKGYSADKLRGSISERVREDLVRAGKLDPSADWPPDVEVAQPP